MSERCRSMREKLSAYADGELAPAEAAAVRAHLAECEGCRDAVAAFALTDEAIASEEVLRSEEDWDRLASRVDDAVARAHEADLHAARTTHGWRRPPRKGFLGGLLPAPVAFGSAGTIVAVLLVVLFRGLVEEPGTEADLLLPESIPVASVSAERRSEGGPAPESERMSEEKASDVPAGVVQSGDSFFVRGGRSSAIRTVADGMPVPDADAGLFPAEELPSSGEADVGVEKIKESTKAQVAAETMEDPEKQEVAAETTEEPQREAADRADLREVEPELVVAPADPAAAPPPPAPEVRTLDELAQEYAQRSTGAAGPAAGGARDSYRAAPPPPPPKDAMTKALMQQRQEQDEALRRARAQEAYLSAVDRAEKGDRQGAMDTLTFLLGHDDPRIRERAWQELLDLDGAMALEAGEIAEIVRVASAAEAFLREYPRSRYRERVLKRRLLLWAEAVDADPYEWCAGALAAEADWRAGVGADKDLPGSVAAERIRNRCAP